MLLLAYGYYAEVGNLLPLVNIGLVSFAAVAQFVPAVLGGLYWKGGTRQGATVGLLAGFGMWFFTLVLPTMVGPGMLPESILTEGVVGNCGAAAVCFVWAGRAGLPLARPVLELVFQYWPYVGVSLARAAHGPGAAPGRCVCGCVPAPQPGRGSSRLAGPHPVARRARAAPGLPG